jgi:hypothetical protein
VAAESQVHAQVSTSSPLRHWSSEEETSTLGERVKILDDSAIHWSCIIGRSNDRFSNVPHAASGKKTADRKFKANAIT